MCIRDREFRFLDAGNGYYIIQPKNVNGVLDVSGGGSANNTRIQLFQYNGSAAQKWKLERRNPGEDERYKEWSEWPKRNCDVFENANLTAKKGRVDTADPVTVFEETGSSYHIRYKTNSGGMKEGWVTRDIFKKANWEEMFEKSLKLHPQHSYWQGEAFGAWECHGFALMIANEISGDNPRNWRKVYGNNALNSLKSGDIIRTGDNSDHKGGHSMVVLYVDGNNIHVVHSNVHNNPKKGWHHRTYWDETYSKSAIINWNANGFNYVIKYPY